MDAGGCDSGWIGVDGGSMQQGQAGEGGYGVCACSSGKIERMDARGVAWKVICACMSEWDSDSVVEPMKEG